MQAKALKDTRTGITKKLVYCAIFVGFNCIGAFLQIPIPQMPLTLQVLFTFMSGVLLGKFWGTAAVLIYVIMGLIGLPVFTKGGGLGYVFMPTFGYIIGFVIGTFVCGLIMEKFKKKGFWQILLAGMIHLVIIYIIGMTYYFLIQKFYAGNPVTMGFLLFYCFALTIPGDLVLMFLGAALNKRLLKVMYKSGQPQGSLNKDYDGHRQ